MERLHGSELLTGVKPQHHQIKVTTLSGGFAAAVFTRSELSFRVFQLPQLLEPSFLLEVQSDFCYLSLYLFVF